MRKSFIIIICLGLCVTSHSQTYKGSLKLYTGQNLRYYGGNTLDSLQYLIPEFSKATIILNDGKVVESPKVNINVIDQNLYFVDNVGDTLLFGWNNDVKTVLTDNRVFVKDKYLMESFFNVGEYDFVIERELKIDDNLKAANVGYGTSAPASSTSRSITSYEGGILSMGRTSERLVDYVYTIRPLILNNSKRIPITKKNLLKILPDKKDQIEQYLNSNKVNLKNTEDVKKLIDFIR